MQIVKLTKKNSNAILNLAAEALKQGKVVVYPTDTSYGLGAVATDQKALRKIYQIKERGNKPIHVLVPSLAYAKKIVFWNSAAQKLAKAFLPGPLSMALKIKSQNKSLHKIKDQLSLLGIRYPKNGFALELAKKVRQPITATSANPSSHLRGGFDPYSANDVISQFEKMKHKPDLVIDAGKLPKIKPSTFVKIISPKEYQVTRVGPISERQIAKALK